MQIGLYKGLYIDVAGYWAFCYKLLAKFNLALNIWYDL